MGSVLGTAEAGKDDDCLAAETQDAGGTLPRDDEFTATVSAQLSREEKEYATRLGLRDLLADVFLNLVRASPEDPVPLLLELVEVAAEKLRSRLELGSICTKSAIAGRVPEGTPTRDQTLRGAREVQKLLGHLCCDGAEPAPAVLSAQRLLARHGVDAEQRGSIITWKQVGQLLRSLESSWGITTEDVKLMLRVLKRRVFQDSAQQAREKSPAEAFAPERMPNLGRRMRLAPQSFASDPPLQCAAEVPDMQEPKPSRPSFVKSRTTSSLSSSSSFSGREACLSVGVFLDAWPVALRKVQSRYQSHQQHAQLLKRSAFLRKASWKRSEQIYSSLTALGEGRFGSVELCLHKLTGNLRALKEMPKAGLGRETESGELMREFQVLSRLDHPHIVRVFEVFEDASTVHIAMEAVMGGTLKDAVLRKSESVPPWSSKAAPEWQKCSTPMGAREIWIAEVMLQIFDAVQYAHHQGVVHKDLKPSNVLLAAGAGNPRPHAVVCDFGISECVEHVDHERSSTRFHKIGGTPFYMSPEMWKGDFSVKADVWSVGVMLFELLTEGTLPFAGREMAVLCRQITSPKQVDCSAIASEAGRMLVQQLLQKNEDERPTATTARAECEAWLGDRTQRDESLCTVAWEQVMEKVTGRSHMDQIVMACVTSQMDATRLRSLNKNFEDLDLNADGFLSTQEMARGIANFGLPEDKVENLLRLLDTDEDGRVEYSEFIAGCLDMRQETVAQNLRVAFSIFDLDKSGFLSREELSAMLQGTPKVDLASSLADGSTLEEVFQDLDSSKDGRISFEEFQAYLLRQHEEDMQLMRELPSPARKLRR